MRVIPLPEQTTALTGFTHKAVLDYTDVSKAATTNTLQIFPAASGTLPIGTVVTRTAYNLITPFTGGAVSAVTLTLGDGASSARYIAAASTDLFSATAKPAFVASTAPYAMIDATATNNVLNALFTATTANLNALTAGKVEIYFCLVNLNDLPTA